MKLKENVYLVSFNEQSLLNFTFTSTHLSSICILHNKT